MFGYLNLLKNNHPSTLTKVEKFVGLVKKLLDKANNLHIMDFDFTIGLGAFRSSLKRKKSFLSPPKKGKRIKKISGLEFDLNIHASEYMIHSSFNISTSGVVLAPTMHHQRSWVSFIY